MARALVIRWMGEPEEKDYKAALSFLGLLVPPDPLADVVDRLRRAPEQRWRAKDILRAAGLPPLRPKDSAEVADKLAKVKSGEEISPILLVGGLRDYLVIADGYHRASAAYKVDEDAEVPARLLWLT